VFGNPRPRQLRECVSEEEEGPPVKVVGYRYPPVQRILVRVLSSLSLITLICNVLGLGVGCTDRCLGLDVGILAIGRIGRIARPPAVRFPSMAAFRLPWRSDDTAGAVSG
jgi:hypothetical protein